LFLGADLRDPCFWTWNIHTYRALPYHKQALKYRIWIRSVQLFEA
jgi:hypothetical protein